MPAGWRAKRVFDAHDERSWFPDAPSCRSLSVVEILEGGAVSTPRRPVVVVTRTLRADLKHSSILMAAAAWKRHKP